MYYERKISSKIEDIVEHFPALVLTGARQAGKTTLLRALFPDHRYISLDLPAHADLAENDPSAFLSRYPDPVVIDEVQYAPKLFRHLKTAIDAERQKMGRFIITGSQKFVLMKEVADSLAGRCAILELENLSVAELGSAFDQHRRDHSLESLLVRGFFPQLWVDQKSSSADFFSSYLATYIERDVRQILNIGSLRDFDRFMRVAATRTGQLLNRTEISKAVGVTAKTINQWISVLEASNQIALLEPYFANVGKRAVKSPKLYFCDCGLAAFLLGVTAATFRDSPYAGALWETFVFGELRKNLFRYPEATLWFYRDRSAGVDFVLSYGGKLFLADAKLRELPNVSDFDALKKAQTILPHVSPARTILCPAVEDRPVADNSVAKSAFRLSNLWFNTEK